MSLKLVTLRSGEDVICDIKEIHKDETAVAYSLEFPYTIKLMNGQSLFEDSGEDGFQVGFYPWQPLTHDTQITIPLDWVVSITNPIDQIKTSYLNKIENFKKAVERRNETRINSVDESTSSDNAD
jgi:hypothetical protein